MRLEAKQCSGTLGNAMPTPSPRDYQLAAIVQVKTALRELAGAERKAALECLPTGGGKTVTAMEYVRQRVAVGERVFWGACLNILLGQAEATADRFGLAHGRVHRDQFDIGQPITIGSVQTVVKRLERIPRDHYQVVVLDEAHRAMAPTVKAVLDHFRDAKTVGLTATPWRLDGQGLGDAGFGRIVAPVSPGDLIARGFLADVDYWRPSRPDLSGLRRRAGEFTTKTAEEVMRPGLGDVVRGVVEHAKYGRVAVFPVSVAHSKAIVEALRACGLDAHHIDAETDEKERGGLLEEGGAHVLCSVGVLDEGVDAPGIAVVVLAAPTASSVRFLQRVGRGMRPGTPCIVLDYGGNVERHWFPTDDVRWMYDLDGAPDVTKCQQKRAGDGVLYLCCDECGRVYAATSGAAACPACGRDQEVQFTDAMVELERVNRPKGPTPEEIEAGKAWRQAVAVAMKRGFTAGVEAFERRTGEKLADRRKIAWLRARYGRR